jgi:hypothetical protein
MNIIFNDYHGRDSYYEKIKDTYVVWLGTKGNRQTNKMHEVAHISLGTNTDEAREKVVSWIMEASFPEKLLKDKGKFIVDTFFQVWNVLEDERVESFSPRLFTNHKKEMGKSKTEKIAKSHPVEALLCARFNRDDLVGKDIRRYITESRLESKKKVYELAEEYINKYVIDYIRKDYK